MAEMSAVAKLFTESTLFKGQKCGPRAEILVKVHPADTPVAQRS